MRKILLIGTAVVFGLTATAWAGAKDKSSNTLADRNAIPAGIISNTLGKSKVKSKGCTIQVQAKPVTMADGDIAICVLEADVVGIGGNSVVVTGEAKAGQLKMKVDLSELEIAGNGCGEVAVVNYNGQIKCYLDDPIYRSDAVAAGTWRQGCTGLESAVPGTTQLKDNPGVPVAVGICQGFAEGDRITPPTTTEFAVTGGFIPINP